MSKSKIILVAPIHWGLGHATRCIPIIDKLLTENFRVIVASDGDALLLLQKEFPLLEYIELPSYNILYPEKGHHFKWAMIRNLPSIRKSSKAERKITDPLLAESKIDAIFTDGRLGVRSPEVPSVFINPQVQVQPGPTTLLSTTRHPFFIKKGAVWWVP